MTYTQKLSQRTWNDPRYYQESRAASESSHPALQLLRNRYPHARILEVGCGEGTKLSALAARYRCGVDVSSLAIKLARKRLDRALVADVNQLPFADSEFDVVVSFFSLEHFEFPERALREMLRVLRRGGELVILTPNFGSPNRASPCFRGSRWRKLLVGFWRDWWPLPPSSLHWHAVTPLSANEAYVSDYDTLVEPYAGSLARYLVAQQCQLLHLHTYWDIELPSNLNWLQRFFSLLARRQWYPFPLWGPHLFVIARRQ